jgi:phosphate transport system protein
MDQHTLRQFDRGLKALTDRLLFMAGLVEQHFQEAMAALVVQDGASAERLAKADQPINLLEMECDELCVRLLMQYQPVASDLRFLVAVMKLVTDLERMGDLTVNIAERAVDLARAPKLDPPLDLTPMGAMVQEMLKDGLDAFIRRDAAAAQAVLVRDDVVDTAFRDIFTTLLAHMKRDPGNVERAVGLLFVAKHLERIADHATNIAEQVLYLTSGKDVRHKSSVDNKPPG